MNYNLFLYCFGALISFIICGITPSSSTTPSTVYYIAFSTPTAYPIFNSTPTSSCGKIMVRNRFFYHLNTDKILQIRSNKQQTNIIEIINYNNLDNNNIDDFYVDFEENYLQLHNIQSTNSNLIQFGLSTLGVASFIQILSDAPPTDYFSYQGFTYKYYRNSTGNDSIVVVDKNQVIVVSKVLQHANCSISFSRNFKYAATWTKLAQVYIYTTSNFSLVNFFNKSVTNVSYSINSVEFNLQATRFILQNQLTGYIVNISNFNQTRIYSFGTVTNPLIGATFLDDIWAIVFTSQNNYFWRFDGGLGNSGIKVNASVAGRELNLFVQTYYMDFQSSMLYTCKNNTISQYYVRGYNSSNIWMYNTGGIYYNQTANVSNTNATTNITNTSNSTSGLNQSQSLSDYGQFSVDVTMDDTQKELYKQLGKIIDFSSNNVFQAVVIFATSTPFTFYFLSFINFLNFSTLYILLVNTIPLQTFQLLTKIYLSINQDILQVLNQDPGLKSLTEQRVDDQRAAFFGISSDLFSFNYLALSAVIFNMIISQLLNFVGRCFSKKDCFRRVLIQNRFEVVCGQLVSITLSLAIVWKYILFGGFKSFGSAVNLVFQYFTFFFAAFFPIFYLFLLTMNQKRQIVQYRKMTIKTLKTMKNVAYPKFQQIGLRSLLNGELLQKWYVCAGNFVYPFFITLKNPIIFLVSIFLFCLLDLFIAIRTKRCRWNSIILSLHPLLLHCCFIIFQFISDQSIIIYTGITVLIIILIGALHNLLSIFVNTFRALWKISKQMRHNRVNPLRNKQTEKITVKIGQFQHRMQSSQRSRVKIPSIASPPSNTNTTPTYFNRQLFFKKFAKNKQLKLKTIRTHRNVRVMRTIQFHKTGFMYQQ